MNVSDVGEERVPLADESKPQKDLSCLTATPSVVLKVVGVALLMMVFFFLLTFLINKSV